MKEDKGFDALLIQKYLDGKLDPKQMHALEEQALNDPFLAEALEGYTYAKQPVEQELSILQRQLKERISIQQENKNIFNFTWQRLSIGAAAGVMFITVAILFWMSTQKHPKTHRQSTVNVELNSQAGEKSAPAAVSRPLNGWQSYDDYLKKNMHYPTGQAKITGNVIVGFSVNAEGRPVNIHIVKSMSAGYDDEAIRLIENGDSWEVPAPGKPGEVQLKINFRP